MEVRWPDFPEHGGFLPFLVPSPVCIPGTPSGPPLPHPGCSPVDPPPTWRGRVGRLKRQRLRDSGRRAHRGGRAGASPARAGGRPLRLGVGSAPLRISGKATECSEVAKARCKPTRAVRRPFRGKGPRPVCACTAKGRGSRVGNEWRGLPLDDAHLWDNQHCVI